MLSMLKIIPPKQRGPIARQWRKIVPPPVSAYLDSIANMPYIKILCEEHSRGIDWRMVEAHSLECSGRLLLPKQLECPAEAEVTRFKPAKFVRRMLENLALEALLCSSTPPSQRSLAVYGNEAEIIQLLPRLTPLIGELKIITRRAYAIADVVSETVRQTGMIIQISDEPDAGDCSMLLAPFGGAGFIRARSNAVVVSPDHPISADSVWVNSVEISIPQAIEEAYDAQYDPLEFTGAFYELAGVRSLARISPDYGCCGEGHITAAELALLI